MKLLFVEDNADDLELMLVSLHRFGFELEYERVESLAALDAALDTGFFSLVISDYNLPGFTATEVVQHVRERNQDLPVIVVSSRLGEERAVDIIRAGASDYVMKDRLARLGPAVERELRDVQLRQERRSLFGALRRSEDRYRRIFEKAPIGVAVSAPNGRLMMANEYFAHLVGYEREELIGTDIADLRQDDDRFVRKDGDIVWTSLTTAKIVNDSLELEQIVWLVEDITSQKQAQERLALQAQLLDAVDQAVFATNPAGDIIYWNRFAAQLYGWTAEEAVGRNIMDVAPVDLTPETVEKIRTSFARGASWSGETRVLCRDGAELPIWIIDTPVIDQQGRVTGIVGVSYDISEQKRTEELLRTQKAQLDEAQALARIGSFEADLGTGERTWSKEIFRIFGLPEDGVASLRAIDACIHPDDLPTVREMRANIMARHEPYAHEYRIVATGVERIVSERARISDGPAGERAKLIGVVQDVTETRAQERELARRAEQQLVIANLGQAALAGDPMDLLLEQAAGTVTRLLGVDVCQVSQAMRDQFRAIGSAYGFAQLPLGSEIATREAPWAGMVVESAAPVVVTDLARETRFEPSAFLLEEGIVSGVTVPISTPHSAQPWGVIGALTRSARVFSQSDVDFLRAIATVLAQAIERDRVNHQLVLHAAQQSSIAELSRLALRAVDEAVVVACNIVCDVLQARGASFVASGEAIDFTFAIPIASSNDCFGAIVVEPGEDRDLDESEIEFVQSLANILADAMERERARHALTESEQRYREVVEGASEIIFTIAADGTFASLNAAFTKLTGWPAEEWLGRPFAALVHPDDAGHIVTLFTQIVQEQRSISAEVRILGRTSVVVLDVTSFPKVENGVTSVVYGFGRDITEARRVENERQQVTRSLQLLLESTVEGILTVDLEGRCTMWNRAAAQILGRSERELGGARLDQVLFNAASDANLQAPILEVARTGVIRTVAHDTFSRADGTLVPVEYSAAPVIDNGMPVGVVISFSDITERRKLEVKLEQADRLTSLGRLAATIAHEFNNVLMGISPFVEVIRRGKNITPSLDHISRSIKRGKRITEDILRFTRPAQPVRAVFEAASWVEGITLEARTLLPAHCRIRTAISPDLRIDGDPNQLQQIFTNLILNARDAMPGGGTLTIEARREPAHATWPFGVVERPERFAHFTVSDSGIGIAPETLRHIFEPLFTTKKNGTGLGLPVTHQVVQRHGGEVFVESTVGVGTTFHIFLPLAEEAAITTHEPQGVEAPSSAARVLLVEDDVAVATGIASLLEMEGLNVEVAGSGAAAIRAIDDMQPDVVVLDVGLPDMEGTSVYTHIATRHPNLPVIFSTGHADRARLDSLLESAHVSYLLKPYESRALLGAIREVMQ